MLILMSPLRGTPFATIIMRWRDLSNPVRYPRFRASASEMRQSVAFAFGVPHDINGFHPYTMSSTDLSHPLVLPFPPQFFG